MQDEIKRMLEESAEVKDTLLGLAAAIEQAARVCIEAIERGGKIMAFGNGGSAADAQHFVGELVGRFAKNREPLPALSLTTNTSTLTAVANDLGFEEIFQRQLAALGKPEDACLAISTSGTSPNMNKAVREAKKRGIKVVALSGGDGGELKELADLSIIVPSPNTPRIQEAHITIIHILCYLIEAHFFPGS